jgi:hypothetical protein
MSEGGAPLNATGPGVAGTTGEPPGGKNILMRLRRKKPLGEEPLDELSKRTVANYLIKSGIKDRTPKNMAFGKMGKKPPNAKSVPKVKVKATNNGDSEKSRKASLNLFKEEQEKFAGHPVFLVDGGDFEKARLGKLNPHRYSRYTGDEEIRQYGLNNPGKPILLKHKDTGAIQFLKYGRSERKF